MDELCAITGLRRTHVFLQALDGRLDKKKCTPSELADAVRELKDKADAQGRMDAQQVVRILSSPEYRVFSRSVTASQPQVIRLVRAGLLPSGLGPSTTPKLLLELTREGETFPDFESLHKRVAELFIQETKGGDG